MKIADLFETRVEDKIEPVIKVGERGDDRKLAGEIGTYVVTGQSGLRGRACEQTFRVPSSARRAAASLHSSQPFPGRRL